MKSWGWLASALGAALLLGFALASPRIVPYDMDEFAHYQPIGCSAFPLTREHNLRREACGSYDLRLPFTRSFLPLRSYLYIGSLPVATFYPFWRVWKDPVVVRIQGALFFLVAVGLTARLAAVAAPSALLAALLLPVVFFTFLVDTGPVGLPVVLLASALLLLQGDGSGDRRRATLRAALAGLVLFLGVWCKPVFLWCIPSAFLFAVLRLGRARIGALLALGASFALPLAALGLSEDRSGDRYYEILRLGGVSGDTVGVIAPRMADFLVHGASVVPRVLATPGLGVDVLPAAVIALLLGLGLLSKDLQGETATWLALATLTLLATLLTGSAAWPHHFVFTAVFLLPALARIVERGLPRTALGAVLLGVVLYWATLVPRLASSAEASDSTFAKDQMLAFVRQGDLERRMVQVHASWGTFYIANLFGDPAQEVIYYRFREWTESGLHLREAKELADSQGRGLLVLTSRSESMTHTPFVEETLGSPLRRFVFGNWEALEYLR